jgi:hypothetical protein
MTLVNGTPFLGSSLAVHLSLYVGLQFESRIPLATP